MVKIGRGNPWCRTYRDIKDLSLTVRLCTPIKEQITESKAGNDY